MSEFATSLRPLNGAEDLDRRAPAIEPTAAQHHDALAELARLVGQQDPFRAVSAAVAPASAPLASEVDFAAFDSAYRSGLDEAVRPRAPEVAAADETWDRPRLRYPTISVRDPLAVEPSPDAWAQGAGDHADEAEPVAPVAPLEAPRAEVKGGGVKRTLVVLGAVMALTGGGLAASFLSKPAGVAMATSSATPTILAATGPSKVQPETTVTGADAPSEPSTLLDKNNNDGTAAAKVVNTVEQPVDLAQAVKPAAPDVAAEAAPPAPGAFPEPRKVKTVLVRPDGSIIASSSATAADAVPAPGTDQTSLAFDPRTSLPVVAPAPAATDAGPVLPPAAAGKATTRATAAKPAASTTQGASAAAQARTPVATPKAKPVAHAAAKPKPAEVADATPTATTPEPSPADAAGSTAGGAGKFSIQLGAAASEAEGHSAAARLAQKYGLAGASPAVVKAEAGGKTVYRIRVGHLSQDEAKAMCAKVQAGGGGCFVAR